ncbi:MAG: DUF748 domain-containing protein [Gammaproteobacteria bacterium]
MTKKRMALFTLLGFATILLVVRALLPFAVQRYVNNELNQSPDYESRIGDVDLSLFRGAYKVENVTINKIEGDVPVALFSARSIEFSVLWSALLQGEIVSEIDFYDPVVNIVDSENPQSQQTGGEGRWLAIMDDLVLLRIDRATVHNGEVHFRNFDIEPPMDAYVSQVNGSVFNLTNSNDLERVLVASIDLEGKVMETGTLSAQVELDPSSEKPSFDIDARMLGLPLMKIDSLIATYAPFDVEGGDLDLVFELEAKDGALEGYFKPLIHNLDVFQWSEDILEDGDNPFLALWESLVGLTGEIFENQPEDQVATVIPVEGRIDSFDVGLLATIGNVLENAFIRAYQARFDRDPVDEPALD